MESNYSVAAGTTDVKQYQVTVSDGQLNLNIADNDSTNPLWAINGLSIWAIYDGGGPAVNSSNLYSVSTTQYDDEGRPYLSTDNAGHVTRTVYDSLGRVTHTIANYKGGSTYWNLSGGQEDFDSPKARPTGEKDVNQITRMVYNDSGQVVQRIAVDPNGDGNTADNQVTRYVYADELSDKGSEVPDNSLLRAVIYPDSDDTVVNGALDDGADGTFDRYVYTYWADGSMKTMTDPRGVVHQYAYDALGRQTADAATSLGRSDQFVSGFVRMIGTSYDDLGRRAAVTSYGDTGGSTVRNQITWSYDGFGNVTDSAQAHSGLAGAGAPTGMPLGSGLLNGALPMAAAGGKMATVAAKG